MSGKTWLWRSGGSVLALGLAGCASDGGTMGPPRMPTVLAPAPIAPVPVVAASEVLRVALESARREEAAEVGRAVRTLPAEERAGVVREVFVRLVSQDPVKAARVARALPAELMPPEATETVAAGLVKHDPAAAVEWALAPASPSMEFIARRAVADGLAEQDSRAAMDRLLALPVSTGRGEMLGFAAAGWVRRDRAAALGWARGLDDGEFKNRVVTSMGFALAHTEPERAVEVTGWLPEGRDRMQLIGAIGQTWVARDPTAAWTWARQFPAGDAREAALSGLETGLGGAGTRSGPRAGQIVAGRGGVVRGGGIVPDVMDLSSGPERERLLRRRFEEVLQESPARAADWLAALPLPDRRDDMVDDVARRWLTLNPEAAKEWMDRTIFLPERKEQLMRQVGR